MKLKALRQLPHSMSDSSCHYILKVLSFLIHVWYQKYLLHVKNCWIITGNNMPHKWHSRMVDYLWHIVINMWRIVINMWHIVINIMRIVASFFCLILLTLNHFCLPPLKARKVAVWLCLWLKSHEKNQKTTESSKFLRWTFLTAIFITYHYQFYWYQDENWVSLSTV